MWSSSGVAHDVDEVLDHDDIRRPGRGIPMVINAEQVREGDIVEYGGVRHVITEIRRPGGGAWAVACDDAGWAIALGAQCIEVLHRATAASLAA
jgi:hypothetical protein